MQEKFTIRDILDILDNELIDNTHINRIKKNTIELIYSNEDIIYCINIKKK